MRSVWEEYVPQNDLAVFEAAGFGHRVGLGKNPALLVIDVQNRTTGSPGKATIDAVAEYPTACGRYAWGAIPNIVELLEFFRSKRWPVIFPCVAPKGSHDTMGLVAKAPAVRNVPAAGYAFVSEVQPEESELVLPKAHASAFFGTTLASHLVGLGVDTLVVTGCTTSGCVRATVVDGCGFSYRVVVAEDAVFDRSQVSHAISLFDMENKYADICRTNELLAKLKDI